MGSVGLGNNANLGAFLNRIFPDGLDLGRCQIDQALGVYVADPASTFRAGSLVALNSSGLLVPATGSVAPLGVAKWNHTTTMTAPMVDEAITLTAATQTVNLKRANVSNVKVVKAGAIQTVTTNYTVNTTNGTITDVNMWSSGTLTVYVSYTYAITEAELMTMQGKNFWNNLDEVSQADGRCTVITGSSLLFTSQYDTSVAYTLTGATSNLYCNSAGLFTSTAGTLVLGKVHQVPSASDPFLGIRLGNLNNLTA